MMMKNFLVLCLVIRAIVIIKTSINIGIVLVAENTTRRHHWENTRPHQSKRRGPKPTIQNPHFHPWN